MPRDSADGPPPPLDVAVIGTGIAGMSAAWLLAERYNVIVYEQDGRIGGHSHTVEAPGPDGPIPVDTGFIVYNELTYPNLTALFAHLDVPTRASDMSFAVSIDDGALEYAGSDFNGLIGQRRNVLRPRFWRMLADIVRFYRTGAALLSEADAETLTLGEYLAREGYSRAFADDHLLPMAAAIWSTPAGDMQGHPAASFIRFCLAHGLMRVSGRPQWRTVAGGSREYVRRLTASYADRIRRGAAVTAVRRTGGGVVVDDATGGSERFDRVIIATHADQALAMLADASDDERRLLGAFRYAGNLAVLHGDPALMPKRRAVWSSWNYLSARGGGGRQPACVTYWMNRLQGIDERTPLFVTLNPQRLPAETRTLARFQYDHPTYDHAAIAAQRQLACLQGVRSTWFCGSYFGAGFHEDALASGLSAAEGAGAPRRSWPSDDSGSAALVGGRNAA